MTKSSLESLDPLVGSPDDYNSPSSLFPSPTTNTTSDTTPSGKYPNHPHPADTPAPTLASPEENPFKPVPVATTAAPLTHLSTTTTPNKQPSCPPHTIPVLTTLTPVLSGPPNPHHHLPLPDTNHHLSLNANHHHQSLTITPQNPKNHHPPKQSPTRKTKKPRCISDTPHLLILTQSPLPPKSKNTTPTQKHF